MLVERVAIDNANKLTTTENPPPIFPRRTVGSQMGSPKMTVVALVTATPMNANSVMVVGNPIAWPSTWSRWLFA